jgi:hypothetical protein
MSNSLNPSGLLERGDVGFSTENLSWAHWLGVLIATVTGAIHVYLYLEQGFLPFLFAGIVFLAAAIAVLLNLYRRLLYAVGIPFTAGQIADPFLLVRSLVVVAANVSAGRSLVIADLDNVVAVAEFFPDGIAIIQVPHLVDVGEFNGLAHRDITGVRFIVSGNHPEQG